MHNLDLFIEDFRSFLNQLFSSYDKVWLLRRRKFDSRLMFSAIFSQVLDRSSTNCRLVFNHLQALADFESIKFSASSYSKARKRFPPEFFVDISQWIHRYFSQKNTDKWFGYSMFAVDSTKITLPKSLESEGFDSMNDCDSYYPMGMLTTMFDLQLGIVYDSIFSQHGDERTNAIHLFNGLPENSVVICDRGFPSFEFMHEAAREKVDLIMRISAESAPEELREFIESGDDEALVLLTPSLPSERKLVRRNFLPEPIAVRAIQYRVKNSKFVLITTLLDDDISRVNIAKLYNARWDIEEEYKFCKVGMELEDFKSKNLNGILQEIYANQTLSSITRAFALASSGPRNKIAERVEHSMVGILKTIKPLFLSIFCGVRQATSAIIQVLKIGISRTQIKRRPGRSSPRRSLKKITRWSQYAEGVSC